MKKIIAVVLLSLVSVNVFGQRVESPDRIFTDQRSYVAEPSARLARRFLKIFPQRGKRSASSEMAEWSDSVV